jgi:hypothetical protein
MYGVKTIKTEIAKTRKLKSIYNDKQVAVYKNNQRERENIKLKKQNIYKTKPHILK